MPDLVCLGEPMIEFNRQPPGKDGRVYWLEGHGGDTSNCAIAAARQGASAGYIAAIGSDPFGDALMRLWADEKVDAGAVIRRQDAPTGIYFVTHSERGHEFTFFRTGSAASRLTKAEIPEDYIGRAKFLETSAISQAISDSANEAVLHAMALAQKRGVATAYDTNLRLRLWPLEKARPAIEAACRLADVVFTSDEEAERLWGCSDADAVLGLGPATVVVKRGGKGAFVATRAKREHIAGHAVKAIDATGAGDTFAGAFLARRLAGDDAFAAGRYANAAAALKTEGYGAVAPIPRPAAVMKLLRTTSHA
ncbi:MAG TPA: sugar kinase [Alphaproteobacteria bacterium]|jgi:2-dehydro-3-deoxygluconokinase